MLDDRVVKRPRDGPMFFKTQHFGLLVKTWLNTLACCGLCQELFLSGAVGLLNSVDDS
jgi:hypothetical protein